MEKLQPFQLNPVETGLKGLAQDLLKPVFCFVFFFVCLVFLFSFASVF